MDTHQSSSRQKAREAKSPFSSKFSILTRIVSFITATAFICIGMLICILNILGIVRGPWVAIIGILFAGIGLIVTFYMLFVGQTRRGEL